MQQLIGRLIDDHRHLSRVLDCLRREMHGFSGSGEAPDMAIVLDIMDYIQNYPHAFHHPLEDRIYQHMRPHISDPEMLKMLARIEEQHGELQQLTTRLQQDFHAVSNDQAVPLERLLSDYRDYAELIAEHMECENRYLIPAIEQYLDNAELERIQRLLEERKDPIFGGQLLSQYEALYQYITAEGQGR